MMEKTVRNKSKITSFDVAKEAGVSRGTVSIVLNNVQNIKLRQETRDKVLKVAKKLGYSVNHAAKSLSSQKSYSLGLVTCWKPSDQIFGGAITGMVDSALEKRYGINFCGTISRLGDKGFDTALRFYREGRVDGLLLFMSTLAEDHPPLPMIEKLSNEGVPFILVNSAIQQNTADDISTDNCHVGYTATSHLLEHGHRKIAFLMLRQKTWPFYRAEKDRFKGYKAALQDHGNNLYDDELVLKVDKASSSPETGYRLFKELLNSSKQLPTGLYAAYDNLAIGVMDAAREEGISVPQDLAIVGTTDGYQMVHSNVPLTSAVQPMKEIGSEAVNLLIKRIEGDNSKCFVKKKIPCKLEIRESCGCLSGEAKNV